MAIVGWRKSSVVPLQAIRVKKAQDKWTADIPVSVSEICMAGLNKSGPVSILCILSLCAREIVPSATGMRLSKEWKCFNRRLVQTGLLSK